MNDFTIHRTAEDLAEQGLVPVSLGAEAETEPTFPLPGMLWEYHKRPIFSMIGMSVCYCHNFKHLPQCRQLKVCGALTLWQSPEGLTLVQLKQLQGYVALPLLILLAYAKCCSLQHNISTQPRRSGRSV